MQFAEMADDALRSELQRAGSAGMKTGWTAGRDLQAAARNPEGVEQRQRVALCVETIGVGVAVRPMAAAADPPRAAGAQCRCGDFLIAFGRAFKNLADLEQREIGNAAIGIA